MLPLLPLVVVAKALLPGLAEVKPPARNAMPEGFGAFLGWLQRGADDAGLATKFPPLAESFELRLGQFGQTLYATRRFERGDTIALIPLSHLVSELNYSKSTAAGARSDLAVYLAQQRRDGSTSPWAAYDSTLPDEHDCRPSNWPPALLRKHLRGSRFPDAVDALAKATRRQYDSKMASDGGLNISWEEYRWGHDTQATRSLSPDPVRGLISGRSLMFPLFDLALHGDKRNIRCKMQEFSLEKAGGRGGSTVAALQVDATRRILPGATKDPFYVIDFPNVCPEPVLIDARDVVGPLQETRS